MKKLLLLCFILISFNLFSKEYKVEVNKNKTVYINIPDDENKKIELILKLSQLYWLERLDLEQTLVKYDDSSNDNFNLKTALIKSNDKLKEYEKILNKNPILQKSIILPQIFLMVDYNILNKKVNGNIGIGCLWLEFVTTSVYVRVPDFCVGGYLGLSLPLSFFQKKEK